MQAKLLLALLQCRTMDECTVRMDKTGLYLEGEHIIMPWNFQSEDEQVEMLERISKIENGEIYNAVALAQGVNRHCSTHEKLIHLSRVDDDCLVDNYVMDYATCSRGF